MGPKTICSGFKSLREFLERRSKGEFGLINHSPTRLRKPSNLHFLDMNLEPLPVEKELRLTLLKRNLPQLSRTELEEYLSETVDKLTRMTHQTKQLLQIVHDLQKEKVKNERC